jgi:cytochrome c
MRALPHCATAGPTRRRHAAALAFAGAVVLASTPCAAGASSTAETDAARGYRIAEAHCSMCHGVAPGDASPLSSAPTFTDLAQRWPSGYLDEALAEGIVVGHEGEEMPEFILEPDEIDALTAYLSSLATP